MNGVATISSYTTNKWRPVDVSPKTTGRPDERLTSASVTFSNTSSISSFVAPCSSQCCTFPLGSSSRSQINRIAWHARRACDDECGTITPHPPPEVISRPRETPCRARGVVSKEQAVANANVDGAGLIHYHHSSPYAPAGGTVMPVRRVTLSVGRKRGSIRKLTPTLSFDSSKLAPIVATSDSPSRLK